MKTERCHYIATFSEFLQASPSSVLGDLASANHGAELTGASCGDDSATITSTSDTEWDIYGYTLFPSETITVKIEGGKYVSIED